MTCCRSEEKHSARTGCVFCLTITGTMVVMNGALNPKPSGKNRSAALPSVTLMPRVPGSTTYVVAELAMTNTNTSTPTAISLIRDDRSMALADVGAPRNGGRGLRAGAGIFFQLAEAFQVLQLENEMVPAANEQRRDAGPLVHDLQIHE